jgi:transketolase N-terminal domain/subunit
MNSLILQPENILLYRKGSLDVKIADFGLSVQVQKGQEMKTLVGTAEYVCKLQHPYIVVTNTAS